MLNRRKLLQVGLPMAAAAALGPGVLRAPEAGAGPSEARFDFDRDWLIETARQLAVEPYKPLDHRLPEALAKLDFDAYQTIRFRPEKALWRDSGLPFQVQFFHLGLYFHEPVAVYEVVDGKARLLTLEPEMFDYGGRRFEPPLPDEPLGFAGFRVHFATNFALDMVAFLGASYFRAVGGALQYGLSARGLAVDTGLGRPEEFPVFRAFWLERPTPSSAALRVHALLDSPSVSGAYSFAIRPGSSTEMDVGCTLFARRPIERLGVAPLTSMFRHGENDRRAADDFRPEVHDSDGLAMLTGAGEWLWRPLTNPSTLRVNSYLDAQPRGFGLLQRDRQFQHYQDDGVYYDRRPNLWVEPLGDWGQGAVQLVEIPTADETFDNIVAYWNPARQIAAGDRLNFAYRLHWGDEMPERLPGPGRVLATRIGQGGIPGQPVTRPSRKFVIDFSGGNLELLPAKAKVQPVVTASSGEILKPAARPIRELNGWRANFDLAGWGTGSVNLRCYLALDDSALTETWIYQWTPPTAE